MIFLVGLLWLRGVLPVALRKASFDNWVRVHDRGCSSCFRWQEVRYFRLLLGGALTMIDTVFPRK